MHGTGMKTKKKKNPHLTSYHTHTHTHTHKRSKMIFNTFFCCTEAQNHSLWHWVSHHFWVKGQFVNHTMNFLKILFQHTLPDNSNTTNNKVKVKQSRYRPSSPEGSRKLRFPDFMTTAQESGKVVSLTHWPHLPPGNSPGTHFC